MFDHVGFQLDGQARRREALAAGGTATVLAMVACMGIGWVAWVAQNAPQLIDLPDDGPMIFHESEDVVEVLIAPAPPAIRRARVGEAVPEVRDVPAEPPPLAEPETAGAEASTAAAGIADGAADGAATGHADGTGESEVGEVDGTGLGRVPSVHHSELTLAHRVYPVYPLHAKHLGDQRCKASLVVTPDGVPTQVEVTACPLPFQQASLEALRQWRWEPLDPVFVDGVQTRVSVRFQLR